VEVGVSVSVGGRLAVTSGLGSVGFSTVGLGRGVRVGKCSILNRHPAVKKIIPNTAARDRKVFIFIP
jgi:hypothetical protein